MIPRIDLTQSEHYTLSIRLSADGFSFSIYSLEDRKIMFRPYTVNEAYSMTANIREWLTQSDELKLPFKKVNIVVDSNRFTTIPFELFNDEMSEALFYHNHTPINNEIVLCNVLGKSNLALLFGMDKYAHQLLNEQFPMARFYASKSTVTELLCQHTNRPPKSKALYAYLRQNQLELYAYSGHEPLLLNSYPCQQGSDQIYYILTAWNKLGLCQEREKLYLIGNERIKEEIVSQVKEYIKEVEMPHFTPLPSSDSEATNEIPLELIALLCYESEEKLERNN
ncbi:MAG: DUF3822 family protein [Phocaeicola sp.]